MREQRILEEPELAESNPKQLGAMMEFGFLFAICVIAGIVAWFRWSGAMSVARWIHAGQFIVGGAISGVFLLAAKTTSREANQKRLFTLLLILWLPQLIVEVFFS